MSKLSAFRISVAFAAILFFVSAARAEQIPVNITVIGPQNMDVKTFMVRSLNNKTTIATQENRDHNPRVIQSFVFRNVPVETGSTYRVVCVDESGTRREIALSISGKEINYTADCDKGM